MSFRSIESALKRPARGRVHVVSQFDDYRPSSETNIDVALDVRLNDLEGVLRTHIAYNPYTAGFDPDDCTINPRSGVYITIGGWCSQSYSFIGEGVKEVLESWTPETLRSTESAL